MKVRLDRLGDEPYTWQETLTLSRDELGHADVLAGSEVDCRGYLGRTTPGFLLRVSLSYERTLSCTRCLGEIVSPVETRFELLVTVEDHGPGEAESARERELDEEDLGIVALPSPLLDTRPWIVEQVQLNVPMKSLCRDDCAGLCPECGADLNAGKCACQPAADPRWADLAKWKQGRSET